MDPVQATLSRRKLPGKLIGSVVLVMAAAIAALRFWAAEIDHAVVNIGTLILGFLAAMTLLAWFCFRSGYSRRLRVFLPLILLIVLVPMIGALRVDGTDGNLIPRFRWVWSKKRDQLLDRIEVKPSGSRIDLRKTSSDDFPGYLGSQRNARVDDRFLDENWAQSPPRLIWRRPIGAGWSGFAAVNGYAVTLEQRNELELIVCYDIQTGEPVWTHSEQTRHETVPGGVGPRSTPTIHEGRIFTLGSTGILCCIEGASGDLLWRHDLLQDLGWDQAADERAVSWGRSGSPLIVDDKVVVPAGGPKAVSLIAFNWETGSSIWEAGTTQISYSSPVLAEFSEQRQIVSVNESDVTGHDPETGRVLWRHEFPGMSNGPANTAQPAILDKNQILLSKAYGMGARLIQLERNEQGNWSTHEVWQRTGALKTKFTNVVVDGPFAFGLSDGILECLEWATGKSRWKSGRYGHGQILGVGKHLLVLSETGELALVALDPSARRELHKIQALDGQTWNSLCLFGNKLLLRNSQEAVCYELPLLVQ